MENSTVNSEKQFGNFLGRKSRPLDMTQLIPLLGIYSGEMKIISKDFNTNFQSNLIYNSPQTQKQPKHQQVKEGKPIISVQLRTTAQHKNERTSDTETKEVNLKTIMLQWKKPGKSMHAMIHLYENSSRKSNL